MGRMEATSQTFACSVASSRPRASTPTRWLQIAMLVAATAHASPTRAETGDDPETSTAGSRRILVAAQGGAAFPLCSGSCTDAGIGYDVGGTALLRISRLIALGADGDYARFPVQLRRTSYAGGGYTGETIGLATSFAGAAIRASFDGESSGTYAQLALGYGSLERVDHSCGGFAGPGAELVIGLDGRLTRWLRLGSAGRGGPGCCSRWSWGTPWPRSSIIF